MDTDTDLEDDNVRYTEELENNTNKKITNVISETRHDYDVLDKTIDFDTAEEADNEMEDTTEITESKLDNKVLDNVIANSTENTELKTAESVAIQITELPVKNINTEEEMDFDDLNIPGDYREYDILEEEK